MQTDTWSKSKYNLYYIFIWTFCTNAGPSSQERPYVFFQHFVTSSSPEFFSLYFCSLCTLFVFLKHALHQLIQAQIWLVGYTTNEKLWVIPKRQPYIQRMWHFCCTCPLCSDKTELGTHASVKPLLFFLQKNYCVDTNRSVIFFNNRDLFTAKSICPTCKQAIFNY